MGANVSEEEDIKRIVSAHGERYGRLDVLVNNAGVGIGGAAGEILTKHLDMQLAVNLRSIVIFYREYVAAKAAAAEHKNALVVNTSSISGKYGQAVAVGLLGHQARGRRLDRSDEQGTGSAGHQVDRALPRPSSTRR